MTEPDAARARWRTPLLSAGALAGIGLAAAGAFSPTVSEFTEGVAARVNGKVITLQAVETALAQTADDGTGAGTAERRREVLDFLINQELLVRRGVELGLLDSDRAVRKALAMAVIDAVVAEAVRHEPSEEELYAFYESHQAVFAVPARAHVRHLACLARGDLESARARATRAAEAVARGLGFAAARAQCGNGEPVLPDTPVPLHALRGHLGPTLAEAALAMRPGDISPPILLAGAFHVLQLVALRPEQARPYDAVWQEVRREFLRRKRDEALEAHLDHLRQKATVVLSTKAPRATKQFLFRTKIASLRSQ